MDFYTNTALAGAHCIEMGFTWTFLEKQTAELTELKSNNTLGKIAQLKSNIFFAEKSPPRYGHLYHRPLHSTAQPRKPG